MGDPFGPAHYYISATTSRPDTLLFCMISSKWEKIESWAKKNGSLNGLVFVGRGIFQELYEPRSVIDCNRPLIGKPEEIAERIDEELAPLMIYHRSAVPETLCQQIYGALQASPILTPRIKKDILP